MPCKSGPKSGKPKRPGRPKKGKGKLIDGGGVQM